MALNILTFYEFLGLIYLFSSRSMIIFTETKYTYGENIYDKYYRIFMRSQKKKKNENA